MMKCKQRKVFKLKYLFKKKQTGNTVKTAATYFGDFKSKVELKCYTKVTEKVERMKMNIPSSSRLFFFPNQL